MQSKNVIIIGAGISGATAAYILANLGYKVDIFDKRNSVSGNLYDFKNDDGILIQQYGPHAFHTDNEQIFKFVQRFAHFIPTELKVSSILKEVETPCPFNFSTIDMLYDKEYAEKLKDKALKTFKSEKVTIGDLVKCSDKDLKAYAEYLYEYDYKPYTAKQWGMSPDLVSYEILARVPVRLSYVDRYFDDMYQAQPVEGFYSLVNNMLQHKNITIHTNFDGNDIVKIKNNVLYLEGRPLSSNEKVIYTGALDELYNEANIILPYRSLSFVFETINSASYQQRAVVAYPMDKEITRITEFSKLYDNFYGDKSSTVIAKEYPAQFELGKNDRYYPILTEESKKQYQELSLKADQVEGLILIGRLANFRYMNMDQSIENSIKIVQEKMNIEVNW